MTYTRIGSLIVVFTTLASAAGLAVAGGMYPPAPAGPVPMPAPAQPTLIQFTCAAEANGYWSFWGQVSNPAGVPNLFVNFDGIPSINGRSVEVNPDGSFSLTIQLQPNERGMVGATLVDDTGTEYDEAEALVS